MRLIVSQNIKVLNSRVPYDIQKKYGEQTILPRIGDKLEDSVWKDPYEYEVIEVVINYDEGLCCVDVAPFADEMPEDRLDEFAQMVKLHGWEASWAR